MKKVRDFLTAENWGKGYDALDKDGNHVDVDDAGACKFCLHGALRVCYGDNEDGDNEAYEESLEKLKRAIRSFGFGFYVADFNDDPKTTWADVKRVLEAADV